MQKTCHRCGSYAQKERLEAAREAPFVCLDCCMRLRENHLRSEARLRAAGRLCELQALLILCLGATAACLRPDVAGDRSGWHSLSREWVVLIVLHWALGATIRELRPYARLALLPVAVGLLPIVPIGTAAGVYLLWTAYGPAGRSIFSIEYRRATRARPELNAKASWLLAAVMLGGVWLNAAALGAYAALITARPH